MRSPSGWQIKKTCLMHSVRLRGWKGPASGPSLRSCVYLLARAAPVQFSRELSKLKEAQKAVLQGISQGQPLRGPTSVHVDITNACNAACITCWDLSPLLNEGRPASWKKRRLSAADFLSIASQLDALGSVQSIIISGMGDPLANSDVYKMIEACKGFGWHVTLLSNLLAGDMERLADAQPDRILVGVHGASPATYCAFHAGWTEAHFATMCRYLRTLHIAGISCRHVQVINRDNAHELVAMVQFGKRFAAQRVNFKLASLYGGTEACSIREEQRDWLLHEGIPEARAKASELSMLTNLDLFEAQVRATLGDMRATTPIQEVGCFMGYLYTRITVDKEVLYCCNTEVRVGSLHEASFKELWYGPAWQSLRGEFRQGRYRQGCDKCGKFEQNLKWSQRYREHAGQEAFREAIGLVSGQAPHKPRSVRLPVLPQG